MPLSTWGERERVRVTSTETDDGGRSGDRSVPPRRRIFVGDVQGCATELSELLGLLHLDPSRDELWFAGDLVNRGPRSLDALRMARREGTGTVLGNHDLHLLAVASGARSARPGDTLDEILAAPDRQDLLMWLRRQPLLVSWPDLWLVHAGLSPRWPDPVFVARRLEREIQNGEIPFGDADLQFLTTVRSCNSAGERPSSDRNTPAGYQPWDEHYRGSRRVVFGHWAARGLVRTPRVRGIDTGCVWGGRLSAWIAEEDRIVSVRAKKTYRTLS